MQGNEDIELRSMGAASKPPDGTKVAGSMRPDVSGSADTTAPASDGAPIRRPDD